MSREVRPMSRRQLLFGMVNRFRGPEEQGKGISGIQPDQVRADKLLGEGDFEAAVEEYRRCLKAEPAHREARAKLGYCLYKIGSYTQASCEFSRVLKKGSDNLSSLYLGLCHARKGDLEKACETWKGYFNPQQPTVQREVNLQIALLETGDAPDPQWTVESVEGAVESCRRELFGESA